MASLAEEWINEVIKLQKALAEKDALLREVADAIESDYTQINDLEELARRIRESLK